MTLGRNIADGLKPIVDLVYPPRCPLCGDAVADQGGLCADCWRQLEVPGEPACSACNRPMGDTTVKGYERCFVCEADPPMHDGIHAATLYNDASRKLILTYKHGRKIALARLLARLIATKIPDSGDDLPLLVPVPLHRWRLWTRGFNQAALLAQELAKLGKGQVLVDGLIRRKRTPSLGGLGQRERERALRGAISVRSSRARVIAGRDVILVDDVLTSGATSNACVEAIRGAEAKSVRVACFARVVDGAGMRGGKKQPENTTPEAITTPGAT
ncbi:ComF family protein [Erythrobacter crassostreae]|uniref:ComF family protein n=1 Tax=Erythrobacter crassostreae TaxID=2828328 RepID=A0A9X1JN03_9SPHN|nr:ComF family protein [Erythrobacter crassostrea]MBV7259959.1 ComF family protein [Erythrobacter crassostrea]